MYFCNNSNSRDSLSGTRVLTNLSFLHDTSFYSDFNYGYFHSINFTFLRLSKAIKSRCIAQWVSALTRTNTGFQISLSSTARFNGLYPCPLVSESLMCKPNEEWMPGGI